MTLPRFGGFGTNPSDNSSKTMIPRHTVDPIDGRIHGIKHGPCRACGHRTIISTASLLCGRQGCLNARIARNKKAAAKKAKG